MISGAKQEGGKARPLLGLADSLADRQFPVPFTMRKMFISALILALLLTACGTSERSIQTGRRIDFFDFTDPGSFEEGRYPGATLSIIGGTYQIDTQTQGVIWGLGGETHTDVSIQVEGRASTTDSDFGVMCRADPDNTGNGYLFAISPGSGSYAILRGESSGYRGLADGSASAGVINNGPNLIRAVCVGNYLALYVNGRFVASAEDDAYVEGRVGLAGRAGPSGAALLTFDNLEVSAAQFTQ